MTPQIDPARPMRSAMKATDPFKTWPRSTRERPGRRAQPRLQAGRDGTASGDLTREFIKVRTVY